MLRYFAEYPQIPSLFEDFEGLEMIANNKFVLVSVVSG